jgi:hypothetical protein
MPPRTWSTPRRSRPSQRHEDGVDSGGSGRSRMLFGGCWAAGGAGEGDTAPGGVAVVGGDLLEAPGDQCHHQSHLPPPRPWRRSSPTPPPPALRRFPWRWRWPRVPDREGAGVSAPVTRPTGRPAVAEEPNGAEGCLATSSKGWR